MAVKSSGATTAGIVAMVGALLFIGITIATAIGYLLINRRRNRTHDQEGNLNADQKSSTPQRGVRQPKGSAEPNRANGLGRSTGYNNSRLNDKPNQVDVLARNVKEKVLDTMVDIKRVETRDAMNHNNLVENSLVRETGFEQKSSGQQTKMPPSKAVQFKLERKSTHGIESSDTAEEVLSSANTSTTTSDWKRGFSQGSIKSYPKSIISVDTGKSLH